MDGLFSKHNRTVPTKGEDEDDDPVERMIKKTENLLKTFMKTTLLDKTLIKPTLNPKKRKNDYVLLSSWATRNYNLHHGEIITLISPTEPDGQIIKRIIGLPGDDVRTLTYKNRHVTVPNGHIWIEGDHHGTSIDSNTYGPVPMGLVAAKAVRIIWPPSRWQKLEEFYPEERIKTS